MNRKVRLWLMHRLTGSGYWSSISRDRMRSLPHTHTHICAFFIHLFSLHAFTLSLSFLHGHKVHTLTHTLLTPAWLIPQPQWSQMILWSWIGPELVRDTCQYSVITPFHELRCKETKLAWKQFHGAWGGTGIWRVTDTDNTRDETERDLAWNSWVLSSMAGRRTLRIPIMLAGGERKRFVIPSLQLGI